jgi:hypothetical protein
MPYREKTLAGATPNALAEEVRAELDAALTANPRYTKVTSGYTGNTNYNFIDVWRNDGTGSGGYPWFVFVAKSSTTANCLLGGALEYDPATNIARKALRIANGYVGPDGYPVTASGGSTEQDFLLSAATPTGGVATTLNLGYGQTAPTPPIAGNILRVLVTDTYVWYCWGSLTTLVNSHGIGTYEKIMAVGDPKPLAALACNNAVGTYVAGTAWRDPDGVPGTGAGYGVYTATNGGFANSALSQMSGEVGGVGDLHLPGPIGSRLMVTRTGPPDKNSPPGAIDLTGSWLGLASDDFLIFDRASGVAIGDSITVNGKVYISICAPAATGGLFINTQPSS